MDWKWIHPVRNRLTGWICFRVNWLDESPHPSPGEFVFELSRRVNKKHLAVSQRGSRERRSQIQMDWKWIHPVRNRLTGWISCGVNRLDESPHPSPVEFVFALTRRVNKKHLEVSQRGSRERRSQIQMDWEWIHPVRSMLNDAKNCYLCADFSDNQQYIWDINQDL